MVTLAPQKNFSGAFADDAEAFPKRKAKRGSLNTPAFVVPDTVNLPPVFDLPVYVAAKLYEDAVLTAGQAAELAQLSKRAFLEMLGKHGVSAFTADKEDLLEDIRNA